MSILRILLIGVFAMHALAANAADSTHSHTSAYAGEETRPIKSLSSADIDELNNGGGWGLAKAAELNGVPGPKHLLELKHEIPLRHDQVVAITALFESMRTRAVAEGQTLIALETELENSFRERTVDDDSLKETLGKIADSRQRLRFIHLSAHLRTPEILSEEQISRYNSLRGYGKSDPCASVPQGHDPDMWRKHNGCD